MNARKLRALMVLHGDNITTLAKAIGISRSTLSATLNGRRDMRVGEVVAIVDRYKLTAEQVDMIFFGRGHAEEKVSV